MRCDFIVHCMDVFVLIVLGVFINDGGDDVRHKWYTTREYPEGVVAVVVGDASIYPGILFTSRGDTSEAIMYVVVVAVVEMSKPKPKP